MTASDKGPVKVEQSDHRTWLVAQLQAWPRRVDPERTCNIEYLMKEAAKVLATTDQQALVAELVEALEPFAKAGELFEAEPADHRWVVSIYKPAAGDDYGITDRHLRRARALLAKVRGGEGR